MVIECENTFSIRLQICKMSLSLQSSDGVIFPVDVETVKQMVTIKTMMDHEDKESDEVIPVPSVKTAALEKVIQWIQILLKNEERINHLAFYSNLQLEEIFEILLAADYLEIKMLLDGSCQHILIDYSWESVLDATSVFHDLNVQSLLEDYKREHGYEVILTMVDSKSLKYFDTKVR